LKRQNQAPFYSKKQLATGGCYSPRSARFAHYLAPFILFLSKSMMGLHQLPKELQSLNNQKKDLSRQMVTREDLFQVAEREVFDL